MVQKTDEGERTGAFRRAVPLLAILVAAAGGAILFGDDLSFEALARNRERLLAMRDAQYGLSVAIFVAAYVGVVALSLPGATVMTLAGGFLFGTVPGVLYNVAAATTGAILLFLAARRGLGEALCARIDASEGSVRRIKAGIDGAQWEVLFLIRLVPVVPFFVANVLPALVNVPLHRFAVSTALGIVPGTLVYTGVGAGLGAVFEISEAPDMGVIFEPQVLLPLLGLCLLALLPLIAKLWRNRARG